jgi:large subunit ribosomal protein L18
MAQLKGKQKQERRERRHRRVRARIHGTAACPRLTVFRSARRFWAQLINDDGRTTLVGMTDAAAAKQGVHAAKGERAFALGKLMAQKIREQNITKVAFDRGGFRFHGRVRRFAEGVREGGVHF